jgi:serine/threonine protein kinase
MPARMTHCDPENLRLLVDDRLAPAEMAGLEEHLERCDQCRARLDRMAGTDGWLKAVRRHLGPETTVWHDPGQPDIGVLEFLAPSDWPDSLGRMGTYEIKGVLGRGGMGVVLKAFDPALHRNVAIKVLSASLATSGAARRRFLREARAAAAVAHEHVVAVHAVVESAGLPFLVMEYVPGRSLQDRLDKDGPLALPEILRIGMQTAAGLAAAHAQGLVHRDVKPANILLENGVERVRLTDFGLARAAADAAVTQSGVVAGTPHYMAPEQARAEAIDHRADLFSLGSTLYAMCTGHPPFRADSAVAVLRRVSDDEPRPVREINPDLPDWLETIIARLHAKSPGDRFASAAVVADLLSRCLAHVREPLSVSLPLESIASDRRHVAHGRRWPLVAVSTVVVGLILTALLAAVFWRGHSQTELNGDREVRHQPAAQVTSLTANLLRRATDEIDQQIEDARRSAEAIETSLSRVRGQPGHDPISTFASELSSQANNLESEIASGRAAAVRQSLRFPTSMQGDEP